MMNELEESSPEVDILLALSATCQIVYLIVYSLYLVLKCLCLLIYYVLVDSIFWSMFSNELLIRQSVTGSQALICGASGKIGRRLALKLARSGVYLILWDSSESLIDKTIEFLQQQGINRVRGHCVDFSNTQDIYEKAEQLRSDYGELDIIFNNLLPENANYLNTLHGDVYGDPSRNSSTVLYHVINAFLPSMLNRKKGHIVSLTSAYGLFGGVSQARLSADAHSVVGLMESLRLDLKGTGVKTTIICSSHIRTSKCSSKSSWLLPPVEPDYLVKCIIEAVELGREIVTIPKSVQFLQFIRIVTPIRFSDRFFKNTNDSTYTDLLNEQIPNCKVECAQ